MRMEGAEFVTVIASVAAPEAPESSVTVMVGVRTGDHTSVAIVGDDCRGDDRVTPIDARRVTLERSAIGEGGNVQRGHTALSDRLRSGRGYDRRGVRDGQAERGRAGSAEAI